jgi:hypothetical protein
MQGIEQRGAKRPRVHENLYYTERQTAHPTKVHDGKQRPRPREVQVKKTETRGHYPVVYKRHGNVVLSVQVITYKKRGQNKQTVNTGDNLLDKSGMVF